MMDFDWRHRGTGRNEFLNGGMSYDAMLYIHPFGGFYGQAGLIWRRHETETWESYRRSSSGFISYGNGQVQLSEFKGPPVVIYGCESWTIKKAEGQRIDAFEPWCWRILLRVPWTARRSNQSILKEINPEYSLEGLMLKLKFQYFGHLV